MPLWLVPALLEALEWLVAGIVVGSVITSCTTSETAESVHPLAVSPNGGAPLTVRRVYRIVK